MDKAGTLGRACISLPKDTRSLPLPLTLTLTLGRACISLREQHTI